MGCGDACPIYPGKRYEDWAARRPGRAGPRDGAPDPRRDRRARRSGSSPSCSPRVTPSRALAAEAIGTFALVFAGCGRDHGRREDRPARPRRRRDHVRARDHGDDLRGRARLGRALQPGRHLRLRAHPALPAVAGRRATGSRSSPARSRPRRSCARSLGNIAHVGATLPSGSQAQSFLWELVMTAFLMFVILAVATDTRAVGEAAAIAIGGTVGLDAMFGGPISGASMNPARSIGPGGRLGRPARALALHRRAARRRRARRARLPVRPRRARRQRPPATRPRSRRPPSGRALRGLFERLDVSARRAPALPRSARERHAIATTPRHRGDRPRRRSRRGSRRAAPRPCRRSRRWRCSTAVTTASTSAPPNWNDVFSRPPARPCSSGATPLVAAMFSGPNASAKPRPASRNVGSIAERVARVEPDRQEQRVRRRRSRPCPVDDQPRDAEAHDQRRDPRRERARRAARPGRSRARSRAPTSRAAAAGRASR